MKKRKITILAFLLFAGVNSINAQDKDNKWALSFGVNAVDASTAGLSDIGAMASDYFSTDDWNVLPAISTIAVSRYMNYGLSVKVSGSLNKIQYVREKNDSEGLSFSSVDAAAVYDLNSLFGDTGWFDPHVQAGLGSAWIDDTSSLTVNAGWGFNSWFNENVGLSFDSTYNYANGGFNGDNEVAGYFQHSLGLIIRFNGDE